MQAFQFTPDLRQAAGENQTGKESRRGDLWRTLAIVGHQAVGAGDTGWSGRDGGALLHGIQEPEDKNVAAQHALEEKIRENNELESYRPKLKQMEQAAGRNSSSSWRSSSALFPTRRKSTNSSP